MNITITGASGFIGKNLGPYLKSEGHQMVPLSLREKEWSLACCDAVIHLAGKAHDTKNTADASEYFQINYELTAKLFEQFLKSEARVFIYFSSVKATADSVNGLLDEKHDSRPATPYGKSKLKAENYLLAQPLPESKRLIILRPCMVHGSGNRGNLNLLYNAVKAGIPWPLAAFENGRSFISIQNLNFLVARILESDIESGIYNVADDESVSTNELIRIIAEAEGKSPRFLYLPAKLVQRVAALGDFLHLPLNSERLTKLTENYQVSNRKIKEQLKLKKLPLSAQHGLRLTIESFKADKPG